MKKTKIIIASDIHFCAEGWYGIDRVRKAEMLRADFAAEYARDPYAALLLLGDYSLDHWEWNTKGTYLTKGHSDTALFATQCLPLMVPAGVDVRMIAGNHEQYGEEKWQEITGGFHRRDHIVIGDFLFILSDTFGGDLDPTEHSDGTYIGADAAEIQALMARYPDKRVVLCAHWFDMNRESEAFLDLLRGEARIVCLMCGHNHISRVANTGEDKGNKPILYTGHYSYSGEKNIVRCLPGYREMILTDEGLTSKYIVPAHTYVYNQVKFTNEPATQDEFELRF
ncbi:MAG: metallophosphoesterase [Clostridia bacterium]|nr:metallophosphoesterase [Clostridia bacterium]